MMWYTVLLWLTGLIVLTKTDLVKLTDDNFDANIAANNTRWLLLFSSPACPHCRVAEALLSEAAERLTDVACGRIQCSVDGYAQCKRFDVHSVPRLSLLSATNNAMWHYDRPVATSSVDDLVAFVRQGHQSVVQLTLPPAPPPRGPSFVEVLGDNNISVAETSEDTWMIDFFSPQCIYCRSLEPVFAALSVEVKDDPDVKLAAVDIQANELSMKRYRVISYPTILVIRNGRYHVHQGKMTLEGLKEFLYHPDQVPSRPLPGPTVGLLDMLAMLYDEVSDTVLHVWRSPTLREQALWGFGLMTLAALVLGMTFTYCILRLTDEGQPTTPVTVAKKED